VTSSGNETLVFSLEISVDEGMIYDPYLVGGEVLPQWAQPSYDWANKRRRAVRSSPALPLVSGGLTPLRGASWADIWDTLTAAGRPLSSELVGKLADNDGHLFELLTGQPFPGHSSVETTGHNHDGTNSATIALPLLGLGLGWVAETSSVHPGANGIGSDEGSRGLAPTMDGSVMLSGSDEARTLLRTGLQCPDRASNPALLWSALVWDASGDGVDVEVSSCVAPTFSGETVYSNTTAQSDGSATWTLITGSTTIVEGEFNYIKVDLYRRGLDGKADSYAAIALTGIEGHIA